MSDAAFRELLKPDGGLSFEGDLARESSQGSGGIEKPAHGSGREGSHVFLHQFVSGVISSREIEGRHAKIGETFELVQKSCSGLHRELRRSIAAGQNRGPEVRHTR